MAVNQNELNDVPPPPDAPPPTSNDSARPAKSPWQIRRLLILLLLVVIALIGGYYGYRYWQEQSLYVYTDNALITGSLIQVGSLNAGRVVQVAVDVGDRVARDQEVATLVMPMAFYVTGSGSQKMGYRATDDQSVPVSSPIDGIVVARHANPGDTVAAGQTILTVVDPTSFWVQAQIEETKIGRVRPGQLVEVTVDTLGQTYPGRVAAINRATSATFSLIPQSNTSGNFTKVTQLVPVKIDIRYGPTPLVLGSSVEVNIRIE
jgi:multidrug resistance efflux pump